VDDTELAMNGALTPNDENAIAQSRDRKGAVAKASPAA
jgi:hypothetical protein